MTDILTDARKYLVDFLKGQPNEFETRHPWRKDWKFAVLHSLRVEAYAVQILAGEPHPLSEDEVNLVRLAAILHDIARLGDRQTHAQVGAEIAGKWLRSKPVPPIDIGDIEKVEKMISVHPAKDMPEDDFSCAVLKDADILDEIGAMSIFMASNWLEKESALFFHQLQQRIIEYELPFCDREFALLKTNAAREILKEKKGFIENFLTQITHEIKLTDEAERMLDGLS